MRIHSFHNRSLAYLLFLLLALPASVLSQTASKQADTSRSIPDTLLFKIQKAQALITEINAQNKKGFGIERTRAQLSDIGKNVDPVNNDIKTHGATIDGKTLNNYSIILNDAQNRLTTLRTTLSTSSNELQNSLNDVVDLGSDSLLIISKNDTTAKRLYADQLTALRVQLQTVGTLTSHKLDTVNQLLATVSSTYLTVTSLQALIGDELEKSGRSSLQKEVPFLWEAPLAIDTDHAKDLIRSTYEGQNKILKYFVASTWDNRILLIFLSALFFVWIFRNYRRWQQPDLKQQTGNLELKLIRPVPVLATLLFFLNLTPLFEPDSPSLYIELTQFLLMIVLTTYLKKHLSKAQFRIWLIYAVSFVLLMLTDAVVNASLLSRLWLIALNISFLYFGLLIRKHMRSADLSDNFIKPVSTFYIVLQVLSIILNIFGRISLAKSFGVTAIIALTQVIGLAAFIQVLLEATELQIRISSVSGGLFSRVNLVNARQSIKKVLSWLAVIIWFLVLFINLGAYNNLYQFFRVILTRSHTFGSVTFTIGNILFFVVIVYLSSLLQKNIGLFFGESQLTSPGNQVIQKSSKLALIRLVIIVGGFLLAISASGISLTQLTVVLGALSVGIGLGMQNIVSNFVSGIILIFEKPFQIGDYIELADKKGKIQDIGIRSSKMITMQGSEVIIPNGDFLSNRLTNWTSTSPYLKTELTFKVHLDTDIKAVTKIIQDSVVKMDDVLKNLPPDVLVNAVGADNIELKVLVWITSIYSEASFKSQLFLQLLADFKAKGIKVM